mgnify:FL=1
MISSCPKFFFAIVVGYFLINFLNVFTGELNSENLDVKNISEINLIKQIEYLYDRKTKDTNLNTLGFWEKIQKIQNVLTNKLKGEPEYEINEMKNLVSR